VTEDTFVTAVGWSYGFAVGAYALFAARAAFGARKSVRGRLLLGALVATAAWAGLSLALAFDGRRITVLGEDVASAARYAFWFAFVTHLLSRPGESTHGTPISPRVLFVVGAGLVASVALGNGLPIRDWLGLGARSGYAIRLGLVVFGLILVEQLVRRVQPQQRWGIKPLVVALAGVFGFELFLYADAMLYGHLDADIWVARGFANVIVIPFIAIATARNSGWSIDLHLSRKAVYHSSALLISGAFLLAVAGAGYVVRYFGGDWARAVEIELLFAAALVAVLVATSGSFRAWLKVFVSKHFFSYRYDYREEWLRFTRTLATESPLHGVQQNTIVALAQLVESPAGALWLRDESRGYVPTARWKVPIIDAVEPVDGPIAAFLARSGWIVDVHELRTHPGRYNGLVLPQWFDAFPDSWLVVPLHSGGGLLGFVVLASPRAPVQVDWEVRDLLKTASRQAASFLGEIRATEALLEGRKFEAFNRMSAFVVHDLKNLVAQLSLMLKNAQRHRDNPAFQADMLATVEHVVTRMNALMLQLRAGASPVENAHPLDLTAVVRRVCAGKAGPRVQIDFESAGSVMSMGHEDRLEHVIGHLLQNAIDATEGPGRVSVRLESEDRFASIVVTDSGIGMTDTFVRERLFKPFQTTKSSGMGIGVYESSQYIASLGGDILVKSEPGAGTTVRVRLPLATTIETEPRIMKEETA